jgi:nucleoside-diphosphate-sugar epimerase
MRVLIMGCGYVGVALGAELVGRGHSVWGVRRSHHNDAALTRAGIVPLVADITVPKSLSGLSPSYDWIVHCVSSSRGGAAEYEEIYLRGTGYLLRWLSSASPAKLVYTSSTSVYGQTNGSRVDETSQTLPEAPTSRILVQTEELLLRAAREAGLPAVVLRVAGIYGPARAYWLDQVRSDQAKIEGDGQRILNIIHRDDAVGAVIAALARGAPGRMYNVVDDEPVTQAALVQWLSTRLGRALPGQDTAGRSAARKRGTTNKSVSNQRLKTELGYALKFPTFREGYEAILSS